MPKPDARQVLKDVSKLETEVFGKRNTSLEERRKLRFREKPANVPQAYKDTAIEIRTPALMEEGRQIFSLVDSDPVPHLIPPQPEDQPATTRVEKFLIASHQRIEDCYGHARAKVTMSQIHDDVGVVKYPMKRAYFKGAPKPPPDSAEPEAFIDFDLQYERFKKDAGIEAVFDYGHCPTPQVFYRGPWTNPLAVYEVKLVDESELMLQHYLGKTSEGRYGKLSTTPEGELQTAGGSGKVKVVEYWDREWCLIIVEEQGSGKQNLKGAFELDAWRHNWGEVPYAFAPAFELEMTDESHRFESPLAPLYATAGAYNDAMSMYSNVGHLTGYPSWQRIKKEDSLVVLDAPDRKKVNEKYRAGEIYDTEAGEEIKNLPMNTGGELRDLVIMLQQQMERYSVAQIARGISPGADTANAAIAQLKRQLKSSLDPMVDHQSNMWRRMYQFMLKRLKELGQPVYVYDRASDATLELVPQDIVTLNVQVRQTPEAGTDLLIEEKQALESWQVGAITEEEYHTRRGKENPEEFVRATALDRLRRSFEPELFEQIKAAFGQLGAIQRLIAAQMETGDAKNAVEGLMNDLTGLQNGETTGMGSGSPGMPRDMGVRSPELQTTTQPGAVIG